MKIYLLIATLLICFAINSCSSAQTKVDYGNNTANGNYYNIRGIKMYCEIYGSGRPLLMIHGNGGSIGSFKITFPTWQKSIK